VAVSQNLTAAIVQARMGSTRLPGKVMMDLAGRTVLSHVLERCRAIVGVDVVCCAVPDSADSDPVADEAARCGVEVFRGSETDVLDRYHKAALARKADVVLRITSDCPMTDPAVAAQVLQLREDENADYACNSMPPTWPHGLDCEAITFDWLDKAAREAKEPFDREHVTPFIRNHPDAHKVNMPGPGNGAEKHRWTIDTPDDMEFMAALFERLPQGPEGWDYRKPLAIVEADADLAAINAGQER
jgi:spore coat polysaccharide biosynthesis protein SpsF (cytidylyltransferase family)